MKRGIRSQGSGTQFQTKSLIDLASNKATETDILNEQRAKTGAVLAARRDAKAHRALLSEIWRRYANGERAEPIAEATGAPLALVLKEKPLK